MLVIVLTGKQPDTLEKLVVDKIKELVAYQAATGNDSREQELARVKDLMTTIRDS